MRQSADVRSIDALKHAKAALAEFREIAGVALSEAQSEIQRTLWWLQHDQTTHWQHEVKRRSEKVAQAKNDLYRAELAAMDSQVSCIEQRKLLQRAEHQLDEARQKLQTLKHWIRILEREMLLFRGQCQPLAQAIDNELPTGEAKLEQMLDRLEAYVRLTPRDTGAPRASGDDVETTESGPPDSTEKEKKP